MGRTATFILEELDLRRAARLHVLGSVRAPGVRRGLAALWIIALLPAVAYHFGASGTSAAFRDGMLMFALVATLAIAAVSVVLPLALSPLVIRRRFAQEALLRQPVTASWDDEGYEVDQPGAHSRIPWLSYAKWQEDRHLFIFFMSDYNYQVLPKRALAQTQIDDIRRVLPAS